MFIYPDNPGFRMALQQKNNIDILSHFKFNHKLFQYGMAAMLVLVVMAMFIIIRN